MATAIDQNALLRALKVLVEGETTKAVSSTPTTTYGHGNGGVFSPAGLSQDIFNAMLLPYLGLQAVLPVRPSMEQNPLYGILTGVTASTGEEPTGVCDDPPEAGLSKLCTQSYVFGRQSRQTRVFELDRMGLVTNRGEFTDLRLIGGPREGQPTMPTIPGGDLNAALNQEAAKALMELGVAWARDFATDMYIGNPTNNTAGGGRKYFRGLDALINTGYRDAITGVVCTAADSIVGSMNGANITTQNTNIVRTITSIYRRLRYNAVEMGLSPVRWVIAMRWALFYELTEIWPCSYMTYRCQNQFSTSQPQFTDAAELLRMRDDMRGNMDMRTGQYLLIDGERVPVVLDDAIAETSGALGSFSSPIYFVPLTVMGSRPATYMEYVNYDAPGGAMASARAMAPGDSFYSTDNGMFLWHRKPPTNFCVQVLGKSEPRLILRTPQLAARLTTIAYTPSAHQRDWDPASAYFQDGGRTNFLGYGPSYYSQTSSVG